MENKNQIHCRLVEFSNDSWINCVEQTYNDSFPVEERRHFSIVKEFIEREPLFSLYIIEKDNKYAGFITLWFFDEFVYVEHFAIEPDARNGGIGAKVIELIKLIAGKPVVLEVELPEDDLSKRRISFYERLGFVVYDQVYFQPPYHPESSEVEMKLMSTEHYLSVENFQTVKSCLYKKAYGVK
ncbi:MAG: GNAT family N-acetyltransferase [Tannerellaceae bacterium]|nr:GNAT family N-acetyltransferase [Tannerellaceae bacterium]